MVPLHLPPDISGETSDAAAPYVPDLPGFLSQCIKFELLKSYEGQDS